MGGQIVAELVRQARGDFGALLVPAATLSRRGSGERFLKLRLLQRIGPV